MHRLYRHFQELPVSMRVLFTSTLLVLGLGYIFALLYVFAAHAGRDGNPALTVEDIIITYSGSAEGTQLESALRGPMSGMLSQDDLVDTLAWLRGGADRAGYDTRIGAIIEQNCLTCHDGSNPHLSNLDGYDNIQETIKLDTGTDLHSLVRASHIHLFGLSFIFFIVGFIFSHAFVRPLWFKWLVIAAPFACVVTDVSSWYFTKLYSGFAWAVMVAGGVMATCFAIMWFFSMYQMWFYTVPEHLREAISD
jgi:hypothetical protein